MFVFHRKAVKINSNRVQLGIMRYHVATLFQCNRKSNYTIIFHLLCAIAFRYPNCLDFMTWSKHIQFWSHKSSILFTSICQGYSVDKHDLSECIVFDVYTWLLYSQHWMYHLLFPLYPDKFYSCLSSIFQPSHGQVLRMVWCDLLIYKHNRSKPLT